MSITPPDPTTDELEFFNDISQQQADSFQGTSHFPECRAKRARLDYARHLVDARKRFREHAEKGKTLDLLDSQFERYRRGYLKHSLAVLNAQARCVSWFIAGPSKFPARRMEKRQRTEEKRVSDLLSFVSRAQKAVIRNLRPDLRPIMASDSDAVQQLQQKINQRRALQEHMRAVNKAHKAYLKNPASLDKSGLSDEAKAIVRTYQPAYSWEPHPFAPYQLSNNNKELKRLEARTQSISEAQATPATEHESESGIRIEDCPPDNRVRLFFPNKPDAEVRKRLKSNGFRWAPSIEAWQAYRNHWSLKLAKEIAGLEPVAA